MHSKILNTSEGKFKDIEPSEIVKALEKYREGKVYHGAGYNVNAAIMQAILHWPVFDDRLKDSNELAILTLTCACNTGDRDAPQIISSFRQITGYTGDIIFSKMCEPNLEQKLVATTILVMGRHNEKMITQSKGFFSGLLQNLPSFFHNFQVHSTEAANTSSNSSIGDAVLPSGFGRALDLDFNTVTYPLELIPEEEQFPDMLKILLLRKESCHDPTKGAIDPVESNLVSNNSCDDQNYGEKLDIVGTIHSSHHIGPAFRIAELWAKKCFQNRAKVNDKVGISSLPVGVRASKLSPDCSSYSDHKISENSDYINQEISSEITDDMSKKNSMLSVRAAMMLEAERGSPKGWNSIVEIPYRGGIYRGRCQGGLPDGKGRLTFMDGSFYEGFWKCGKRSGLGTFCYSNGDLFRGPWRDDVMHGKGWFYFHTGDRWFANFWRGKANGEGRFFSKNGSVFFGIFRDGWRHGHSVCIDSDGSRWTELWDDGVLVDRKADN